MKKIVSIVLLWAILSAAAGSGSPAAAASQPAASSLVVKLAAGLTPVQQALVIARDGGAESASVPVLRLHTVTVPDAELATTLQAYQADPQVERVEVNGIRKAESIPSDAGAGLQWSLDRIGWTGVFGRVTPAGRATIALLDTGLDGSHPDLAGAALPGFSLLDGGNGLSDPNGHGTSLAGIAAAATDNGIGIAGIGYQGVQIMPVTVLGASGTGRDSDIIAGIVWAADHGADVILMGFSNPDFSQNLQDAVDYAWSKGAVLVAATGNDGVATPTFPAANRGVVGVSATDQSDFLAYTSNFGPDTFLAAPGADIYTTSPGGGYRYISGTSASSALVAGAAAFLKAVDPTLSNGVIVARLGRSADAIGPAGDPGNQLRFGNGRVNLASALADSSSLPVQPAGAALEGTGGPFIGPYTAASAGSLIQFSGQSAALNYGSPAGANYVYNFAKGGAGVVTLACADLPAHAACSFNPSSGFDPGATGGLRITVTVTTDAAAPAFNGAFTLNATQSGQTLSCSSQLVIAPKALTMSGLAVPAVKVYDGTPAALVSGTPALQSAENPGTGGFADGRPYLGDAVHLTGTPTGSYNSKNVALASAVSFGGLSLAGAQAGNYTLTLQGPAPATIGPRALSVSGLFAASKPYDGGTGALVSGTASLNGVLGSDSVTLSGTPSGSFADASAAAAKSVSISGLSLSGAAAGNYLLVPPTASADIVRAVPVVSAWPSAGGLSYGQPLSAAPLSGGTASAAGSFAFAAPGTLPGAGSYLAAVIFTPFDSANYSPVSGTLTLTVVPAPQSINFVRPGATSFGAASFALAAAASSALPVSFNSLTALVCTVSGSSVTILGAGTCTVKAAQGGNANYAPAAEVLQSFLVARANQAPVSLSAPASASYGSPGLFARAANGSGTGAYLYSAGSSTACSINPSTGLVAITSGSGSCSLSATRAGDANYNDSAPSAAAALSVAKASQTISFPAPGGKGASDPPFALSAASSSGLPAAFTIVSGPATLAGTTVTITGVGTIVVRASQGGNGNYNAAQPVDASIVVAAAPVCSAPGYLIVPATNVSGSIYLFWSGSGAAESYVLEQSVGGAPWSRVYSGPNSYVYLPATVMGSYAFRVKTTRAGFSDSAYTSGSKACAVTLGTPSGLSVPATNTSGSIYLHWSGNSPGETYVLEQSVGGAPWSQVYSGSNSAVYLPATVMGSYAFRVKATKPTFSDSGYATGSSPCAVTLGAPSSLTVPATGTGGPIYLSWSGNSAGAGYVLEQSVGGAPWSQVYSGPNSAVYLPVALAGSYSFRVKATKAGFSDSGYASGARPCIVTLAH
jgi:hypothetical protein